MCVFCVSALHSHLAGGVQLSPDLGCAQNTRLGLTACISRHAPNYRDLSPPGGGGAYEVGSDPRYLGAGLLLGFICSARRGCERHLAVTDSFTT